MKNLRISKKNPSKILKILQVHPATHRYSGTSQPLTLTMRNNPASIISNIRQSKIIQTHRDRSLRQSPSRSHKLIQAAIQSKNKKSRNRSLGSSQQAIKNQEQSTTIIQFRNSHQLKLKNDYSPYVRRAKLRQSEKFLNFHSVSLGQKAKRQEKQSKQKQAIKALTRKKSGQQKKIQISQNCIQQKSISDNLQNAKKLLSQGQYRKSLYLLKGNLQILPNHLQSLFLSAVNWYHLEDRIKAVVFIDQILNINSLYSAECYKLASVCYSKAMQYDKSLLYLEKCHNYYPDEVESYRLEGKIYSKVKRWEEASLAYQKAFQLSQNTMDLFYKAICFQELRQYSLSIECYQRISEMDQMTLQIAIKKMSLHNRLHQYEECIQTYESLQLKYSPQFLKQVEEYLYLSSYAFYKLKKYSKSLVIIDEAMRQCANLTKFYRLLMMIRIHERDIYEAFHLVSKVKDEPELRIIMKFIEGVIELIRRNYQYGIDALVSISKDLGFKLQLSPKINRINEEKGFEVSDQFLYEIRSIYLMFLSYGYFNISEFQICRKLLRIQQSIGVPEYFELGFSYNLEMCEGIIYHLQKQFSKAQPHFLKASKMYENKLQPIFSVALNCLQLIRQAEQKSQKQELTKKATRFFDSCKKMVDKQNNNTAASVYYFSSLLHGYLQEWKQALDCIDQSVERSEDHYWRYFYVRGLLLACVHSFREAVNDLSLAISLSGSTRPQCYLLRSKCLQIEGQGNQAFKDLQEYISLKPDDPEVHKYAGQILFENGAFEDSLVAFSHQTIPAIVQNYDYFLTQAKSFFLLGKFKEAEGYMEKSQSLKFSEEIQFDILIIKILDKIVTKLEPIKQIDKQIESVFTTYKKLGKIFKQSDYHVLKALCGVFQSNFEEAISQFLLSIEQKSLELGQNDDQDQAGIAQNTKDLETFNNQMKYNIVLCKLSQGNFEDGLNYYKQIHIDIDQPYYGDYVAFRKLLNREVDSYKKEEVFPNRNKLSNFLDKISLTLMGKNKQQIKVSMKLCVPFPKVEPPEIFPCFDKSLLSKLSVLNVERKPQAPWVIRQNNSIKFTEKIETFSRFEMEDSQNQSTSTYQMIPIDKSHIDGSQRSKVRQLSQLMLQQKKGRRTKLEK